MTTTTQSHGATNDLAYQDAKRIVEQRTTLTNRGENMDTLAAGLLWRLMEVTDPDDFRRIVAEAVESVTPSMTGECPTCGALMYAPGACADCGPDATS